MVIKDEREAICQRGERQQGGVVEAEAAVHEHQRIALADNFDEETHVPNWHDGHWSLPVDV